MNTFNRFVFAIALFCAIAPTAPAQTLSTITTLSAGITSKSQQQIVLSSATGVFAPTGNQQPTTMLWIDKELFAVEGVSGTTITVRRAAGGTRATPHLSGAYVYIGAPQQFGSNPTTAGDPAGTCTRGGSALTVGNVQYLPFFNAATGIKSDCLGGVWVNGVDVPLPVTEYRLMFPDPGGTAYTSLNSNGTAVGATTLYCTEVNLPYNKVITGIGVLNGTTVTANARYVVLYDAAGNALANSALAGQASVTASVYETYPFTAKFLAVGPAQYFGCLQDNAVGSTTVRMLVTGVQDNFLTKGQTSAVFGTIKALTPPTTFTTAVGPYIYLY